RRDPWRRRARCPRARATTRRSACDSMSISCRSRSRSMRSRRASGRCRPSGIDGASCHERRGFIYRCRHSREGGNPASLAQTPLGHARQRVRLRGRRFAIAIRRWNRATRESMNAIPGKRGLRWLLLASASLSAIALFLLATATANTALFAQGYDNLLILNGLLASLLMVVVGWQLWQLRRNLKAGVFGSRLAVRLVLLFALVAVLPGALVYAVSVQFIGRSIESWFDVRVDRALEGGLNLGRNALDYLLKETASKAGQMAVTLAESPGNLAATLNRAAEQANVYEAALFSSTGSVLAVAGM